MYPAFSHDRIHISNNFSKLQVVDRAEAILWAPEAGLGEDQQRPVGRIPE